jgi:hypothetical protein
MKPAIKIKEKAKISHNKAFEPDRTKTAQGNRKAISISKIKNNRPTK